jgi:group I intron endonuclease
MTLYEITNIVTGMGYVGITKDRVKKRWWAHKKDLRMGRHANRWLQNSYNKYGVGAFEYKIRQKCGSIEELSNLEKQILKDEKDRLYNIKEGGYDAAPIKHTEESKRKISEAQPKIPVVGMSIKTGEIREYATVKDVKIDGFNYKNIGKCCKLSVSYASGRTQQAISTGKWVWMYKSEFNIDEMNRRREMAARRGNNDQSRAIIGKSLIDGNIVNFRSCMEANKTLKTDIGTIRKACLGDEVKSAAQYVWVFADEAEPTILLEKRYVYALDTFNGHRVIGPRSKHSSIKKV